MISSRSFTCRRPILGLATLALMSFTAGCGASDSQTPQTSAPAGNIQVTTTSSGGDADLNAYLVKIGDDSPRLIEWNDTVTYTSVSAGDWTVQLQDVSQQCSVADGAIRNVSVADKSTTEVPFEVSCASLPAAAVDVSGTWTGDFEGGPPQETGSLVLVLTQDGDDVTGSVETSPTGSSIVHDYDIEGGRVSGSTMKLWFFGKPPAQSDWRYTMSGKVTAQGISGSTAEQMDQWSGTWTVTLQ